MKNYVSPKMELVLVNITDVITTSYDTSDIEFDASALFS